MNKFFLFWAGLVSIGLLVEFTLAVPKYEGTPKTYNQEEKWRRAYYNNDNNNTQEEPDASSTKDRLQRLGYTTGYGGLNGYPGSSTGLYNPIKLDLGGVVLGTLVGIGAIIIIPKLLQAFHGGYSGYGRSEDSNDLSSLSSMINRIDDILGQSNIDSTSCMQRAICTYVQSTEYNMKQGTSDQMDQFVHMLSENSLVDYLLDGTAIKEALENAKKEKGRSCEDIYASCPLNSMTAMNILTKLMPKKPTNGNAPAVNSSKQS